MENSIRIYPHLQDTGGFFIAVLQHRRSTAAPKYIVASPSCHTCLIFGTREGKRAVEEEVEEPNVKKARLDGDEDVMMPPVTEHSTSKCNSHLMQTRDRH
jgi:multisite-specific tRNA:(cytosine-C5)-methyltransferase